MMRKERVAVSDLIDEELIMRVQNRDQEAFSELMSRYTTRVWGVVVANSRQQQDAEEINTDIWVAVWQNITDLRSVESFGAWLHRIAYNACQRYYTLARQSQYEVPHEFSVIAEHIDQQAGARYRQKQLYADVKEAVHHLPQKVRSVAELFYLESWHIKEIAAALNLPIGTVKTKLRETRTLLRKEFDAEPIRGTNMSSNIVRTNSKIPTDINKQTYKRRPAILNVDSNDSTGNSWALQKGVVARFGKGKISDVKLSPDGTYFAVATGNGLWWYDLASMLPISLWEVPGGYVNSIDFSHDGKWIVISTVDSIVMVMDVKTGECVMQIKEYNAYGSLACSSNGRWVAVADGSGQVNVLDIQSGKHVAQMDRGEHKWKANDIYDLQFTPDGTLLAARAGNPKMYSNDPENYDECVNPDTEGDQVYVWNPDNGEVIIKFSGRQIALSSDNRFVAAATPAATLRDGKRMDTNVSVWDISNAERLAHFTEHEDWVNEITFSPCGEFVASTDGILRVWDIATGTEQSVYPDYHDPFYSKSGDLYAISYQGSNTSLEVFGVERNERILEIQSGVGGPLFAISLAMAYTTELVDSNANQKQISEIPSFKIVREPWFPWPAAQTIWVDDQTLVSHYNRGIAFWDVNDRCLKETLFEDRSIGSITKLPSENILVSHLDDEYTSWVVRTLDHIVSEFSVPDQVSEWSGRPVISRAGDRIAAGSTHGNIYIWNLDQTEDPLVLTGHTDHIWTLAFSLDGRRLVSGSRDESGRVWDVDTGEETSRLSMDVPCEPMSITYSPDGNMIAADLETEIRFWCADRLTTIRSISQPVPYMRTSPLAFSVCGRYLAGATWYEKGYANLAVRIWDVASCEEVGLITGHTSTVTYLSFSPNGKLLSGGCRNGTILVWDLESVL